MGIKIRENAVFVMLAILIINVMTNVDFILGGIYGVMLALMIGFYNSDKAHRIKFTSGNESLLRIFGMTALYYAIFIVISIVASAAVGLINSSPESVIQSSFSQLRPIFSQSKIFTMLSFGIVASFTETMFIFGMLHETIADLRKIPIEVTNRRWIGLALLLAGVFTIFHFSAKQIPSMPGEVSIPGLTITFIFGLIQMIMIGITKQTIHASLKHAGHNFIAVFLAIRKTMSGVI